MRVIGLHLTKCAGTSIMSSVKRNLSPEQFYFCSSFIENIKAGQQEFVERVDYFSLQFVFGHYVHEVLHSLFRSRGETWMTVLRDPSERLLSEWNQLYSLRVTHGLEPLTSAEFLARNQNSLCTELLRAFPSMVTSGSQIEDAKSVLMLFDYIFDSEDTPIIIASVHDTLQVPLEDRRQTHENISAEKDSLRLDRYQDETREMLKHSAVLSADDIELYEWARSVFTRSATVMDCNKFDLREEHLRISSPQEAMKQLNTHLARFYGSEIDLTHSYKAVSDFYDRRLFWNQTLEQIKMRGNA
jgi:hypothetical protein